MKHFFIVIMTFLCCPAIFAQEYFFKRYSLPDTSLLFKNIQQGPDQNLYVGIDITYFIMGPGIPIEGYPHIGTALLSLNEFGEENYFIRHPKIGFVSQGFPSTFSVNFKNKDEIIFPIRVYYDITPCDPFVWLVTERIGYHKIKPSTGELINTFIYNDTGPCEKNYFLDVQSFGPDLKIIYRDHWRSGGKAVIITAQDSMYQISEFLTVDTLGIPDKRIYKSAFYKDDYINSYEQSGVDGVDSLFINRVSSENDSSIWSIAVSKILEATNLFVFEGKNKISIFADVYHSDNSLNFTILFLLNEAGEILAKVEFPFKFETIAPVEQEGFLCTWYQYNSQDITDRNLYIGYVNLAGELINAQQLDSLDQFDRSRSIAFIPPNRYAVCGNRYKRVGTNVLEPLSSWLLIDSIDNLITTSAKLVHQTGGKSIIHISPNPANNYIVVDLPNLKKKDAVSWSVLSIDGKIVDSGYYTNDQGVLKIEIKDYPAGVFTFFARDASNEFIGSTMFIKL